MSLYVLLNSVYSIATDSSIYVGLNFLTDPVMATAVSIFCGGPVWFGSAYVYILLQQYKDTHQMTLTTISAAETETMLIIIDDSD